MNVEASFLSKILGATAEDISAAIVERTEENSQTMPLLRAFIAPEPHSTGGADITIIEGQALEAEAGPLDTPGFEDNLPDVHSISIYTVRPGDTIGSIAKMFNVTVNTIIWANNIKNNRLVPGEELAILPITGVQHTVKKGDTPKTLATKYKADVNEILQFNGLEVDGGLSIGMVLTIPDGEVPTAPKSARSTFKPAPLRGANGPTFAGYYERPAAGPKTQGLHGYNGIDFGGRPGESVWAAAAGEVIISRSGGWNGGYGNYIVISHPNGTQTLYAHLSRSLVSAGVYVAQGQLVGLIGSTGKSTGPHLHFEVRGARNPF